MINEKNYFRLVHPVETIEIAELDDYPEELSTPSIKASDGVLIGPFKLSEGRVSVNDALPPSREWCVDNLLPTSTLAILAGIGGVSKTAALIAWAVHVALGRAWAGRRVEAGAAVLFLGEESVDEVSRRVNAVAKALDLSAIEKRRVQDRLLVFPLAGVDFRLTELDRGNVTATEVGADIVQVCEAHTFDCGQPVRLVGVDHAKLVMAGDANAAADVTALTRVLTEVAVKTGAATVLLAHSPKSSINREGDATAADVAGNSAFVDNARCAMLLRTLRDDEAKVFAIPSEARSSYATLELFKSNYSMPGLVSHLVRHVVDGYGTAVPLPIELLPVPKDKPGDRGLEGRIFEFIRARPGQLTRNKLCSQFGGKSGPLKASDKDIERGVAALLNDGQLTLRPPTSEERERYAHNHNVRLVLDVATMEDCDFE